MRKALTMRDVMKLTAKERVRRGKQIGAKNKRRSPEPASETDPRSRLKRWRDPEKPIEIIG
jgi:hypothetical protein